MFGAQSMGRISVNPSPPCHTHANGLFFFYLQRKKEGFF